MTLKHVSEKIINIFVLFFEKYDIALCILRPVINYIIHPKSRPGNDAAADADQCFPTCAGTALFRRDLSKRIAFTDDAWDAADAAKEKEDTGMGILGERHIVILGTDNVMHCSINAVVL